jgi:hypothetical protein
MSRESEPVTLLSLYHRQRGCQARTSLEFVNEDSIPWPNMDELPGTQIGVTLGTFDTAWLIIASPYARIGLSSISILPQGVGSPASPPSPRQRPRQIPAGSLPGQRFSPPTAAECSKGRALCSTAPSTWGVAPWVRCPKARFSCRRTCHCLECL